MLVEDFIKHAKSDLAYADGLRAHIEAGGEVTPKNISDLLAMVKWNAENLVECLTP